MTRTVTSHPWRHPPLLHWIEDHRHLCCASPGTILSISLERKSFHHASTFVIHATSPSLSMAEWYIYFWTAHNYVCICHFILITMPDSRITTQIKCYVCTYRFHVNMCFACGAPGVRTGFVLAVENVWPGWSRQAWAQSSCVTTPSTKPCANGLTYLSVTCRLASVAAGTVHADIVLKVDVIDAK